MLGCSGILVPELHLELHGNITSTHVTSLSIFPVRLADAFCITTALAEEHAHAKPYDDDSREMLNDRMMMRPPMLGGNDGQELLASNAFDSSAFAMSSMEYLQNDVVRSRLIPSSTFLGWLQRRFIVCGPRTRRALEVSLGRFPEVILQKIVDFCPPGITEAGAMRLQVACEAFGIKIFTKGNAVALHRGKSCLWVTDVAVTLETLGLASPTAVLEDPCREPPSEEDALQFLYGLRALSRAAGVKYVHPSALGAVRDAMGSFCRDVVAVAAGLPSRWDHIDDLLSLARAIVYDEQPSSEVAEHKYLPHDVDDENDNDDDASCSSSDSFAVSSSDGGYSSDVSAHDDDDDDQESVMSSEPAAPRNGEVVPHPLRHREPKIRRKESSPQRYVLLQEERQREARGKKDLGAGTIDVALKRLAMPILGSTDDDAAPDAADVSPFVRLRKETKTKQPPIPRPSTWTTACPGCGRFVTFQSTTCGLSAHSVPEYLTPCAFVDVPVETSDSRQTDAVFVDWAEVPEHHRTPTSASTRRRAGLTPPTPRGNRSVVGPRSHVAMRPHLETELAAQYRPVKSPTARRSSPAAGGVMRNNSFGHMHQSFGSVESFGSSFGASGPTSSSVVPDDYEAPLDRFVISAAGGHRASGETDDDVVDLVDYWACKLIRTACEYARTRDSFTVALRDCYAVVIRLVGEAHCDDGAEFGRLASLPLALTDWIPGLSRRWWESHGTPEQRDGAFDGCGLDVTDIIEETAYVGLEDSITGQVEEARELLGITIPPTAQTFLTALLEAILRVHFARIGALSIHVANALTTYAGRHGRPVPDDDGTIGRLLPRDFILYRKFWLNLRWFVGESMDISATPYLAW